MAWSSAQRETATYLAAAGALAVLGLALSGTKKKSNGRNTLPPPLGPRPKEPCGGAWVDADAPRRIRSIAAPVELATGMFGLGDFLAAVSFLESRGKSTAGSDTGNAARGWFGMRPESARVGDAGLTVAALKNERQAVALAAWYAWRLRPYALPGQVIDWLALRRGWGYPFLVSDVDEEKPTPQYDEPGRHARELRESLAAALPLVCVEPSFMYRAVFTPGVNWPGIGTILGLTQGAVVA